MAISYAHKLGEFIGTFFESTMKQPVKDIAKKYGMYFDSYGYRKARGKDKVSWEDARGSRHDLDYVIEENGTDNVIGAPVAFIELAWRRYTKHSKNKVQEIAAAVDALYDRFKLSDPFKGVILSGEFTENSLKQLRGDKFHVLYISYSELVDAFKSCGIDIYYDEKTPESWFSNVVNQLEELKQSDDETLAKVSKKIINNNKQAIGTFLMELSKHFDRRIKLIRILPLHGIERDLPDVSKAISFIENYKCQSSIAEPLKEFLLWVVYNNGDEVKGDFGTKDAAIDFLSQLNRI